MHWNSRSVDQAASLDWTGDTVQASFRDLPPEVWLADHHQEYQAYSGRTHPRERCRSGAHVLFVRLLHVLELLAEVLGRQLLVLPVVPEKKPLISVPSLTAFSQR